MSIIKSSGQALCVLLFAWGCKSPVKYVPIADSKVYFNTTGEGEPVVLLHGGFLDSRMWDAQVEDLSTDHKVITVDLRGHGKTEDGATDYLMTDAIKKILDTLGIKKASILGHSMGGEVATEFALQYPASVNRLLLMAPGMNKWTETSPKDTLLQVNDSLMDEAIKVKKDTALAAEYFVRSWFDGPQRKPNQPDSAIRSKVLAMVLSNMKQHHLQYWPRLGDSAAVPRLHQLKMPVYLIYSQMDNDVMRMVADSVKAHVRGSTFAVFNATAHMPNLEHGSFFNSMVRNFLSETPPDAKKKPEGTGFKEMEKKDSTTRKDSAEKKK